MGGKKPIVVMEETFNIVEVIDLVSELNSQNSRLQVPYYVVIGLSALVQQHCTK